MPDFMINPLPALKGLWGRLPGKSLVLIATGIFILGAISGLAFVRTRVGDGKATPLGLHLATAVDTALIVLIALLVIVAIAVVAHAVFYHDAR
jgi:hypothetical protein